MQGISVKRAHELYDDGLISFAECEAVIQARIAGVPFGEESYCTECLGVVGDQGECHCHPAGDA